MTRPYRKIEARRAVLPLIIAEWSEFLIANECPLCSKTYDQARRSPRFRRGSSYKSTDAGISSTAQDEAVLDPPHVRLV